MKYFHRSRLWALIFYCLSALAGAQAGVPPPSGLCSSIPDLGPQIQGYLAHEQTSRQFVDRLAIDPAYAAKLGDPVVKRLLLADVEPLFAYTVFLTYPPLDDPDMIVYRLRQTGEFAYLATSDRNTCFSTPPSDTPATFIEFYNPELDHYFYSGNASEIVDIDAGKVGHWIRTGENFVALEMLGCFYGRSESVVYRFYGIPGRGPNSHFLTTDRAECYAVEKSGQWSLEGVPFYANTPASDGTCAGRGSPLYRVWRPFGDSNHRFTTKLSIVDAMKAQGWVVEGLAMCLT